MGQSLRGSYQKDKPRPDSPCGDGLAGQAWSLLESEEEGPDDNFSKCSPKGCPGKGFLAISGPGILGGPKGFRTNPKSQFARLADIP